MSDLTPAETILTYQTVDVPRADAQQLRDVLSLVSSSHQVLEPGDGSLVKFLVRLRPVVRSLFWHVPRP